MQFVQFNIKYYCHPSKNHMIFTRMTVILIEVININLFEPLQSQPLPFDFQKIVIMLLD